MLSRTDTGQPDSPGLTVLYIHPRKDNPGPTPNETALKRVKNGSDSVTLATFVTFAGGPESSLSDTFVTFAQKWLSRRHLGYPGPKRRFPGDVGSNTNRLDTAFGYLACQMGYSLYTSRKRAKAGQEFHNFALKSGVRVDKSDDSGKKVTIPGCLVAGRGRRRFWHFCNHDG